MSELRHMGPGRYPNVFTEFSLNLSCDPGVQVKATFNAEPMEGYSDVIRNTNTITESVGVQVLDENEKPVIIGEQNQVVESATNIEMLKYKAFYYYNGGLLEPGRVTSLATVVFEYQ